MGPVTPKKPSPVVGDEATELTGSPPDLDRDDTVQTVIPPLSAASDALQSGEMLGEYRVERMIGRGGMGTVYSVVHPMIGKHAAVKVLNRELCSDPHSVERFLDEARVVNEIGHPNIVDVFAFGEMPDGRHYFVMEYLGGESLHARLERPIPLGEAVVILRQLVRALEAAHGKGIIHRDLKPDNIFVIAVPDEPLRVKLLDFGIAKLVREERRIERTATGAMVGTPLYIAPEQAKGHAIDASVDIYALGGIAFELLTGRPPFVADNAMEIVAKHLMEPPPRPSQLASVPRALDDLVHRMLAKEARARPSLRQIIAVLDRASDWSMDLAAVPAGDPALSMAVTRPLTPIPEQSAGGGKRAVLAIVGMLVACVVTFAIVTLMRDDDKRDVGSGGDTRAIVTADRPVEPPAAESSNAIAQPAVGSDAKTPDTTPSPSVTKSSDTPPSPPATKRSDAPNPSVTKSTRPPATKSSDTPVARSPDPKPPIVKTPDAPSTPAPARIVKRAVDPPPDPPSGRLVVTVINNDKWTVAVDGVDRGHVAELSLPVGHHNVELHLANEPVRTFAVDIEDGGSRSIRYTSPLGDLMGPGSTKRKTP